jgi:two-component system sensor kinase FixL
VTEYERALPDPGTPEIQRLRESFTEVSERFRFTNRINREIWFVADGSGALLDIEPRWAERTGTPVSAALGFGFLDAIHRDDRPRLSEAWALATRDAEDYLQDHRVRMADGSFRWYRCHAEKLRTRPRGEVRWRGLLSDVDELLRTRAAAQASEARFRTAARASRDVVWELNIAAGTIDFSDCIDHVLGYADPHPSRASWWRDQVHPDDLAALASSFRSCPDGERWEAAYRIRRADGVYIHVQSRAFINRDRRGRATGATGTLSDLTEERATQARIEQLQREMLDTTRSGTAAALAAMLSHELNQPLTALTNYVRGARRLLQRDDPASRDRILTAIDAAATNALQAGAIVQRMRDLVSRGEGRLSAHNLWDAADDARTLTGLNTAMGGVRIMIAPDLRAFDIIADRVQTRQVLLNLLRNAVDALQETPGPAIAISAEARGDFVQVAISDNGSGFGADSAEALFAPFVTSKMHGVGLGLAISQMIVESTGGRIWAERNVAGGATFCFTLPLAETAA